MQKKLIGDGDLYVNEHYKLLRFFTKPELDKQSSAGNEASIRVGTEYNCRQAEHKNIFYSANYNEMMSNEMPENVTKLLSEICVSLPHALPINFELVCVDEISKLSVCLYNNKMKGWFRLYCKTQAHIQIQIFVLRGETN